MNLRIQRCLIISFFFLLFLRCTILKIHPTSFLRYHTFLITRNKRKNTFKGERESLNNYVNKWFGKKKKENRKKNTGKYGRSSFLFLQDASKDTSQTTPRLVSLPEEYHFPRPWLRSTITIFIQQRLFSSSLSINLAAKTSSLSQESASLSVPSGLSTIFNL